MYGKCLEILTLISLFPFKILLIRSLIHNMEVGMANSVDPDQTALAV